MADQFRIYDEFAVMSNVGDLLSPRSAWAAQPSGSGFYWWRKDGRTTVLYVGDGEYEGEQIAWTDGETWSNGCYGGRDGHDPQEMGGEWQGPIQPRD